VAGQAVAVEPGYALARAGGAPFRPAAEGPGEGSTGDVG
jgi:hypothetical protein